MTPFRTQRYVRHNARRLEHLATLGLPLSNRSVLELGAGIGDHTTFFLDRGCTVTAVEGRPENLAMMRECLSAEPLKDRAAERLFKEGEDYTLVLGDLDQPEAVNVPQSEVVHCYGLLYHVRDPLRLLEWIRGKCADLLLLETCVAYPDSDAIILVDENASMPTQALAGRGSRPSRPALWTKLRELFPHVYVPRTQPNHEEFPVDWTLPRPSRASRAVFVASQRDLGDCPTLLQELPLLYERS